MKLAIKEIFPSFNAFHAAWFCHNHALDKKYRVLENKARKCFRANCFSAPALTVNAQGSGNTNVRF
jgi:hypothetical protein